MVTIYHNPRCSKSREALALLEARGISPEVVLYLEQPPSSAQLSRLLEQLGMRPRELLRQGEAEYRTLGLDDVALSDAVLIEAMVMHPKLIERPVVVMHGRAVVGRPPERVLELISRGDV